MKVDVYTWISTDKKDVGGLGYVIKIKKINKM